MTRRATTPTASPEIAPTDAPRHQPPRSGREPSSGNRRHHDRPAASPGDRPPQDPDGRDLLARAVITATWYLEVRAGKRPVAHLHDRVSPPVARQLDGLVRRRRRHPRAGATSISLLRVWAQRRDGIAHVVVVLREHQRTRPVALAMEIGGQDPRIVALGLPEDRVAPAPTSPADDDPDGLDAELASSPGHRVPLLADPTPPVRGRGRDRRVRGTRIVGRSGHGATDARGGADQAQGEPATST